MTEPGPRRGGLVLLAILLIAGGLRLWGIGSGLPHDLTTDEPHYILQALRIGAGEGGPLLRVWHTVGKGGLDVLLFVEYGFLFVFWWLTGRVSGPDDFAIAYLRDPTAFYLLGRMTVALMGTLTCLVIYAVGKRLYGPRVGLGAAAIGAGAYAHALNSHLITVHVGMALSLWASVLAFLVFQARRKTGWLVLSGALGGLAIAQAYTAGIGTLVVLAAIGLTALEDDEGGGLAAAWRNALVFLAATLATVAVFAPSLLLNAPLLLANFSQLLGGGADGSDGEAMGELRTAVDSMTILRSRPWRGYVEVLMKDYNILVTLAAILGMVSGAVRRERWTLLLSAAVVSFLVIVSVADRSTAEIYLFPIVPALWLLAARGIAAVSGRRPIGFAALCLLVVGLGVFRLVQNNVRLSHPDTRIVAKDWIEANVPSGAKILMDGLRFRFVPSPPLSPGSATVKRRLHGMEESEFSLSPKLASLYERAMSASDGPTYDLFSTVYGLEVEPLDYYIEECFDYIVLSSSVQRLVGRAEASGRYPATAAFYRGIVADERFPVVYTASPDPWGSAGPTITVYRVEPSCPSS